MKYRANLFKKNILKELDPESIAFVENIHHSLVEISDNEFNIELLTGEKHKYSIQFSDKDIFTSTHLGQFTNGNKFRFIQPIGVSLEMAMLNQNSEGGFSIGSIDPSGWAFNFYLTAPEDLRDSYKKESEKSADLEKLMRGLLMAFEERLQNKFLEIGKRILPLIESDPMQIYFYDDGEDLAYKLKGNKGMFTDEEQRIIEKIELR
jgi:hypothetical protein